MLMFTLIHVTIYLCVSFFLPSRRCVSFRVLDNSAAAPSQLWMVGEHLSPVGKPHNHQMMADVSRSCTDGQQPDSPAEIPVRSPGRLSRTGDEEQQRAGAGWEGSFTAKQEPPSASRSEGSHDPQAKGGSRSYEREVPNPGEDRPQAEKGLCPGGREDSEHLATAARQHTTVAPHHSSPPLFATLLRHSLPLFSTTLHRSSPPVFATVL